jgi:hypothetical protein
MRVKGTAVVDLVKSVKGSRSVNWERYLEPQDFEIVNSLVIASKWYPGDSFWRISWAVAKEIGRADLNAAFEFGRISAKSYLRVYKRLVVPGDPVASLKNCVDCWQSFYDVEGADYRKMEVEPGAGDVSITAWDYPGMIIPEVRKPYFHGLAGYFQEMAEQASRRRVANTIRDNGGSFQMTYRW